MLMNPATIFFFCKHRLLMNARVYVFTTHRTTQWERRGVRVHGLYCNVHPNWNGSTLYSTYLYAFRLDRISKQYAVHCRWYNCKYIPFKWIIFFLYNQCKLKINTVIISPIKNNKLLPMGCFNTTFYPKTSTDPNPVAINTNNFLPWLSSF